jgi:GTP-binding protein
VNLEIDTETRGIVEANSSFDSKLNHVIETSDILEILLQDIEKYPPPAWKGKYIKIKYVTQLPTKNPVFAFFCNLPQYIKEPYTRYLENRLRENFDFEGVPIKIVYKNK